MIKRILVLFVVNALLVLVFRLFLDYAPFIENYRVKEVLEMIMFFGFLFIYVFLSYVLMKSLSLKEKNKFIKATLLILFVSSVFAYIGTLSGVEIPRMLYVILVTPIMFGNVIGYQLGLMVNSDLALVNIMVMFTSTVVLLFLTMFILLVKEKSIKNEQEKLN